MAARALLLALPEADYEEVKRRIRTYLADAGAVGGVVTSYSKDSNLEEACLQYWESRIEPESLRLEDLVGGVLIALTTSILAHIIIDAGRALIPKMYERYCSSDKEEYLIREISRLQDTRARHAQALIRLLQAKLDSETPTRRATSNQLSRVYDETKRGVPIEEFVAKYLSATDIREIRLLHDISKGVLLTEEGKSDEWKVLAKLSPEFKVSGLPQSPAFGFGEIVKLEIDSLLDLTLSGGARPIDKLIEAISASADKNPNHKGWEYVHLPICRKVVPICDAEIRALLLDPLRASDWLKYVSGFVTFSGGMTSHLAVFSRQTGRACIGLDPNSIDLLKKFDFAAIHDGEAKLFQAPPKELLSYLSVS